MSLLKPQSTSQQELHTPLENFLKCFGSNLLHNYIPTQEEKQKPRQLLHAVLGSSGTGHLSVGFKFLIADLWVLFSVTLAKYY